MTCVFCKIAAGEIAAQTVFADDRALAFLDIRPVQPGHVLLIPKKHYPMMADTPDDEIQYLFVKAKTLMQAIRRALRCNFVVLSVVGIEVPHFHIHLIPRYHNDGLANFWPEQEYKGNEMKEVGEKIRREIKKD